MTRASSVAAPSPRASWQSLLRLPLLRRSLSRLRPLPAIGASAVLLVGLGTLAVTLDATPEQIEPGWHGRIDGRVPVDEARAARLLAVTAIGLGTELRRAGTGRVGEVRVLDAELVRLRDAQADLGKQQAGLESRLAAAIELASVKGGAFDLVEQVRALRLVPAALLLREEEESGRPFAPALDQFAAAVAQVDSAYLKADPPVMKQIASLQPYAENGVLSWRDLRRSFDSLAGLIDRADPVSWWDWALIAVGWRDDPLAPLHAAQAALMVDDLEGAIASLAAFQGEAALVTEGWLVLARARLAADALVEDLYQIALAAGARPPALGSTLASSSDGEPAIPRSFERSAWPAAPTNISGESLPR
jgi:hypothetical protein